jgi:hypothetical protein
VDWTQPEVPFIYIKALLAASISVDMRKQANKRPACVILAINTDMKTNTNPALDFYAKLLLFLVSEIVPDGTVEEISKMSEAPEVSLTVSVETLLEWEQMVIDQSSEEMQMLEDIACSCFEDLACQMRTEAARELMQKWIDKAGIPNDLFIHHRKFKDLGDGAAVVTVVVNDIERFRLFCEDPEKVLYAGRVHLSISDVAKDPD